MAKEKKMCVGCRQNFYNGNNSYGIKECWSFKSAKVVTRVSVGTWQAPPYEWRPQKTFDCHSPEGRHWLKRDDCRVVVSSAPPPPPGQE